MVPMSFIKLHLNSPFKIFCTIFAKFYCFLCFSPANRNSGVECTEILLSERRGSLRFPSEGAWLGLNLLRVEYVGVVVVDG